MGKTLIDIDEELLAQARLVLGTDTKRATVNLALHNLVRRWAVVEFAALARGGLFDDLLEADQEQRPCW
jgi:Arc/MetJ family transcription regulator